MPSLPAFPVLAVACLPLSGFHLLFLQTSQAQVAVVKEESYALQRADSLGLYSPTGHYFLLDAASGGGGANRRFHFGEANLAYHYPLAFAGDFDGDRRDSVGVLDWTTGTFSLGNTNAYGAIGQSFSFGDLNSYPLAGDFDGDGVDGVGTFDPVTARFLLRNELSGGAADHSFVFGDPFDLPIVGDFDGDGVDSVGVFDVLTNTFELRNTLGAGQADLVFAFGTASGVPVCGDFDGDGIDSVGLYDAVLGRFELTNQNAAGPPDALVSLGDASAPDWWPVVGNWDRRGATGATTGFDWPPGDPATEGFDPVLLDATYLAAAGIDNLHSLLVVRRGTLVAEEYFRGFDASRANNVKSVSKSILSALVGLALERGDILSCGDTVESYLPSTFVGEHPAKASITLFDLLTMRAGLFWNEGALAAWIATSNWVDDVVGKPFAGQRGVTFHYSTGLTHLASAVLTAATGSSTSEFADTTLFDPLGIQPLRWDFDRQGIDLGGSELFLLPRDMARFGELFLRAGTIDGQAILDPDWVASSTAALVTVDQDFSYGAWWWRRTFAGHDVYFAWGHGGQFIFVAEDLDMVVVATSEWEVSGQTALAVADEIFELLEDELIPSVLER